MMAEIIDYAGLFPPARLPMSEALDRYLRHIGGPDGWLLATFVCPAGRLDELAPLLGRLEPDRQPLRLAVLGRGGDTADAFIAGIESDLLAMERFTAAHGDHAVVEQLELRLPDAPGELCRAVTAVTEGLETAGVNASPFLEVSLLDGWRERLPALMEAIVGSTRAGRPAGVKIRCGGLEARAVPSTAAITSAIAASRRAARPIKATQGLHHAIRHFDVDLDTTVHGFLNLFAAGVLAGKASVSEELLLAVIEEEGAEAFVFTEDELRWEGLRVDVDEIVAARRRAITSFGSCSFTDVRDDLKRLGLTNPQDAVPPEDR
jgi:hypothetical protein